MTSIVAFPAEIVLRVFRDCEDFKQVTALSSTCKYLQAVWLKYLGPIVWDVGRVQIPMFNDILIAVSYDPSQSGMQDFKFILISC